MVTLTSLWLPIVVSSVIVFLASWLVHTMLPHHKSDFSKLANEDDILAAMHKAGAQPGDYAFPYAATMKDMQSPEMTEKYKRGPVGVMTVSAGNPTNMGASLMQWFIYLLIGGVLVAYVTTRTLSADTHYLSVFRIAGVVAFIYYAGAHASSSIWYKRKWSTTWKYVVDGFLYSLLTAGTFGWLWPR